MKGRDHSEDLDIGGVVLECILGKCGALDSSGSVAGSCEHGSEPWGSIKVVEYLG
jgi:hypothetical protein